MEALNMNNLLDAPENSDKAKYASWVTSVPVGLTFATLGLVGNTVSLIVWDRVARKTDVSGASIKYFKLLGVVNSCFLISYFLADTLQSCLPSLLQNYIFLSLYSYCFFPLFYYFNYATIWTMFAINIERYLICVRQIRLSNWTRMVLLIMMYIFGIILNVPNVFVYEPFLIQTSNTTTWTLHETQFSRSQANMDYKFWVHCFLICILPLLIMTILNISIFLSIRNSFKSIKNHLTATSHRMRQDRSVGITLFSVTLGFLVLLLWECIATCLWFRGFKKSDPAAWTAVNISFAVGKLAIVFHSSLNCMLYFITGSLFRSELRLLLTEKLMGKGRLTKLLSESNS
eukprot:GFUD01094645.1.p1 GENE.GFUD01094645.1~~GFUD01094645.1.p1  ORF type:complete len:355 (+),score=59.00 GFUD01094645.1:36-1067(+)